jgi:V/A-type H+-transporting ATPase subunit K
MDKFMIVAGAIACLGLSAAGSAFGTGFAATAAVGAWKKCYAANKPAPFLLLSFVGAPITQTLYGMILMFLMLGKTNVANAGVPCLVLGIFAGLGIGLSALFQGRAGAAACDSQAETNQGFTNYLAALGIVETVAIFTMVFTLIALGKIA